LKNEIIFVGNYILRTWHIIWQSEVTDCHGISLLHDIYFFKHLF